MRQDKVTAFALVVCVSIAASCSSVAPPDSSHESEGTSLVILTPTTVQVSVLSSDEIAELKNYAEAYQPRSGREVIPSPPVLPEKISQIIAKASAANSREHESLLC
jgi:hypothetical protein